MGMTSFQLNRGLSILRNMYVKATRTTFSGVNVSAASQKEKIIILLIIVQSQQQYLQVKSK